MGAKCRVAAIFLLICHLTSTKAESSFGNRKAQEEYLTRYAYMGPKSMNLDLAELSTPDERFSMAVEKFQMMTGLNVTGIVDSETQAMMKTPRCGMPDEDMMGMTARKRKRRYVAQGSAWRKTHLTYRINNVTPDLNRDTAISDIRTALKRWSDASPITFSEVTSQREGSDININFTRGDHGDGFPFDGPGRVLAHAFFPQHGGVHFDEDETWSSGRSSGGTDLLWVAIHEFGHTLGLSHSDVKDAIMYPYYRGYTPNARLHSDDIAGINYIYGSRRTTTRAPTTTRSLATRAISTARPPSTRTPTDGPFCRNFTLDAFFQGEGGYHLFKGAQYYNLTSSGIVAGYPKPIATEWPGLPNDIDTALYVAGCVYFFKGDQVWNYRLATREPQDSYPQRISRRFRGLPSDLDAAFIWSGNGKLYFTKGNKYYKVSNFWSSVSSVDRSFPRPLRRWKGLPARVDAAFVDTNSRTYFIRGDDIYRFNDMRFKVDAGYPMKLNRAWLHCPSGSSIESNQEMMEKEMAQGGDQFDFGNGASNFYFASLPLPITINVLITLSMLFSA